MNKIKYIILTLSVILGFCFVASPSYAADPPPSVIDKACAGKASTTAICLNKDGADTKVTSFIQTLVNVLLFILGAVCVVVIVLSGFFYATSGGDSALIAKAKNTLLYAVIGLIVAILAYALVGWVISAFQH